MENAVAKLDAVNNKPWKLVQSLKIDRMSLQFPLHLQPDFS
jgi:hypothetical protein